MILLVGEAPGGDRTRASSTWRRLAAVLKVKEEEIWERAVLMNLLKRRPPRDGKGDAFPMSRARRSASRLVASLNTIEPELVVLCGRRVARAFDFHQDTPYFEPGWIHTTEIVGSFMRAYPCVVAPHPSGVNTWYNDARNRGLARRAFRQILGLEAA